ncbi:hypothetical protein F0U62_21290 [Cystobacter fuscus]|uniref:hypothetical protein n=1 Tax=Cystobacter fuscus TaxID=43 RepID=UPI002B29EF3C|nr:hypothetical protein F0U62_21290 [Cystobacter fuscus]
MLKFTAAQMHAISESRVDDFSHRLLAQMRTFFPEARVMTDEQGHAFIRRGFEHAAAYGIFSERDVARYVGLMLVWGEDFDKISLDPWIRSTLMDVELDPGYKLELLYDHAAREER